MEAEIYVLTPASYHHRREWVNLLVHRKDDSSAQLAGQR
jgi:hypothetical protein